MRLKILLTGKNGQIGWELQRTLSTLGDVIAPDSRILDLTNPDAIRSTVREVKPQLVVNTAAYTAVDKAEPELAMSVNGVAPGILAEESKRLNAVMIHYSTDYVFNGKGSQENVRIRRKEEGEPLAFLETDQPNPLNTYGRTKLAGDQAIQAVGVPHLIFRASWVYGLRRGNFFLTILKLAKERSELKIVCDQIGSPTWNRTIAEVTAQVLVKRGYPSHQVISRINEVSGLYNLSCDGQTSWHGFAKAIIQHLGAAASVPSPQLSCKVISIATDEYPLPAKRPPFSKLDCGKLERTFGLSMPNWERSLALACEELNALSTNIETARHWVSEAKVDKVCRG